MPRYKHNDNIVDAIRYQPSHAGHIIHRLSEIGIPCIHLQPTTQVISIFDPQVTIDVRDPRHDFQTAEGLIYPGDWIVWRNHFDLEIVSSPIFQSEYVPLP